MKRNSKKGFTLAELLIVVAILAILVAIMMPVFGAQLAKARLAADLANVRSTYSELVASGMIGDSPNLQDVKDTVKIAGSKLAAAVQYGSKVYFDGKEIIVEYESGSTTYTGKFAVDSDVTITTTSGATLDSSTSAKTRVS